MFKGKDIERAFDFSKGEHKITLVSENGEVAEVKFYIIKRKEE